MAVPILADLRTAVRDYTVTNVTVDPPISDAVALRTLNDAYADIWEATGSSATKAAHATLWTPSPPVAGNFIFAGAVANIKEVLRIFRSTTVGSVGSTAADFELDRMELSEMNFRRRSADIYPDPIAYALERSEPAAAADVGKLTLHIYPDIGSTVYYLPAHYVKTKTDLSADADVPDLTELLARDVALLAAVRLAPRVGRPELVGDLEKQFSERTREAFRGRDRAWLNPKLKPDEVTV